MSGAGNLNWTMIINMPTNKKGEQSSERRKQTIEAAVAAVKSGESMRSAARRFGIPNSILQDHCRKSTIKTTRVNKVMIIKPIL